MTARWLRTLDEDALASLFERLERANTQFDDDAREGAINALDAVTAFISAHSPGNEHLERPIAKVLSRMRGIDPARVRPGDVLPPDGGESGGVKRRVDEQKLRAVAAYAVEFLHTKLGMTQMDAASRVAEQLDRAKVPFAVNAAKKAGAVKQWWWQCSTETNNAAKYFAAYVEASPIPESEDTVARELALYLWVDGELHKLGFNPPGIEWLPTPDDFAS